MIVVNRIVFIGYELIYYLLYIQIIYVMPSYIIVPYVILLIFAYEYLTEFFILHDS